MPKYSKLQEKALELLDYKINFKRGIETATKHATKHDVNVKNSDEFLGHITKYKNEIRELVGEVKQANLPRSTSPEAAPTPDKSNSTKCGAHKRGGAGQVRVRKQLLVILSVV